MLDFHTVPLSYAEETTPHGTKQVSVEIKKLS